MNGSFLIFETVTNFVVKIKVSFVEKIKIASVVDGMYISTILRF